MNLLGGAMPFSPSFPRKWESTGQRTQPGFTLLELLVALLVVSVGLSLAVLSMKPDTRRQLDLEGQRLQLLFDQVRDEALQGGQPLAWLGRESGYQFLRREVYATGSEWRPINDDDLLRERTLPDGMQLGQVWVDGLPLPTFRPVDLGPEGAQRVELQLQLGEDQLKLRWDAVPPAENAS